MKRSSMLLAALVSASCFTVSAQNANYTEGTVSQVTSIQVTQGHLDDYMTYLRTEWKPSQEALKKAGIITDTPFIQRRRAQRMILIFIS